jgi:hypothetical protein
MLELPFCFNQLSACYVPLKTLPCFVYFGVASFVVDMVLPMFVIFVQEERGPGQSPEGEGKQVLQCWGQHSGSRLGSCTVLGTTFRF